MQAPFAATVPTAQPGVGTPAQAPVQPAAAAAPHGNPAQERSSECTIITTQKYDDYNNKTRFF